MEKGKTLKKTLALILTFAMVVGILPAVTPPARAFDNTYYCTFGDPEPIGLNTIFTDVNLDDYYILGYNFTGSNPGLSDEYGLITSSAIGGITERLTNSGSTSLTFNPSEETATFEVTVYVTDGSDVFTKSLQFITSSANTPPTVTTTDVTTYAATTATMGGNVTADGGATVTERGVVYSSSAATPTIGETGVTQAANGSGTGSFSESIGSLSEETTYYVRAYATNAQGTSYGAVVSFSTKASNSAPTDISLSSASIDENAGSNAVVGTLTTTDPNAGNTFTYTLVAGTGDTDNSAFNISGSSLRMTNSPDFETKSSYSVRIRTTDQGALTFEKAFTITVNNVNEAPTDISLSATSIDENVAANTTVGSLTTTDPDAGNTFTYTLVLGTGDTDNASFNISGSSLRMTNSPDFETKSNYSVRIRTTDQGVLTFEKEFTITVNNVNEAPVITAPGSIAVTEDTASALTGISITDADAGSNAVIVTLSVGSGTLSATSGGGVTVGGTASSLTLSGSIADINAFIAAGNVSFTTASNATGSVTLGLSFHNE